MLFDLSVEGEDQQAWALPSVAGALMMDGIEGDFTDDEESSPDEGAAPIPLQVLNPLLTVRGFLIS